MNIQNRKINSSLEKQYTLYFIVLLIGIFSISFAPIFVKLSINEISPNATIFNRFWIASIVFSVWNGILAIRSSKSQDLLSEKKPDLSLPVLGLLLLMGSSFAAIQLLWAWSLSQTSVASSITILHALRPLLTALGGWILFKNNYDRKFLLGIIIAVLGAILIGFNDFSDSIDKLQGDLLSVFSAILSALELLIMEHLLKKFSTQSLMLWNCIIGTCMSAIVLLITGERFLPGSWQGWLAVISLALVSQVLGHGLITYSLNYFSSGVIAVTMLLDPVLSALFAWTILSEQLSLMNGVFCGVILLGIYLTITSQYTGKSGRLSSSSLVD